MECHLILSPLEAELQREYDWRFRWRMVLNAKLDTVTYTASRLVKEEPLGARGLPEFHSMRAEVGEMANVQVPEWVPVVWQ